MPFRRCLNAQHDLYLNGSLAFSWNTPWDPSTPGWPRLDIDRERGVLGWHSNADSDELTSQVTTGRRGEWPNPRTSRGKTLTYNLLVRSRDADGSQLDEFMDDLRGKTQDISTVGLLVATPWPGVADDIWSTFAHILAFDGDELNTAKESAVPSPFIRQATLSLRQIDGIWLYANEAGDFLEPMVWSNTGVAAAVVVTNSGKAAIDPVVTVEDVNEGEDVHIGRDVPGGSVDLWFRNPLGVHELTGPKDLVVDFGAHPRKASIDGLDVTDTYDASSSNWWDEYTDGVPPGDHNLWIGPGAGTGINVHFFSGSR